MGWDIGLVGPRRRLSSTRRGTSFFYTTRPGQSQGGRKVLLTVPTRDIREAKLPEGLAVEGHLVTVETPLLCVVAFSVPDPVGAVSLDTGAVDGRIVKVVGGG